MPRLQLKPKDTYPFRTKITVRVTDLNYGGHLGNDSLISLIHEARCRFLASYGWTEMDCGGTALILGDAAVVYQGEAFGGDVLQFEAVAGESGRCGFRLFFRVTRISDQTAIALVENGMICFDYNKRKIQPLPEKVREICE